MFGLFRPVFRSERGLSAPGEDPYAVVPRDIVLLPDENRFRFPALAAGGGGAGGGGAGERTARAGGGEPGDDG